MSITLNGTTGISGVDGSSTVPAFQGTDTDTGLFYSANTVSVSAGGSKVATINAYGIGLGTGSPSSGIGITFPATQSASSDANTLDDYEEGTWTPNQGSGLTVVGAFSSSGTYTKIGRQVTVIFKVSGATSIAVSAGGIITSNLPFTALAGFDYAGTVHRFGAAGGQCIAGGGLVYNGAAISAGGGLDISITYFV